MPEDCKKNLKYMKKFRNKKQSSVHSMDKNNSSNLISMKGSYSNFQVVNLPK